MLKYEVHRTRHHIRYLRHDKLHRTFSPAFLLSDSYRSWHEYGKYHRKDGPCKILKDGTKYEWRNGRFMLC